MVSVRVSLEGATEAAQAFREIHARLDRSPAPLMAGLGQAMVSIFQENIRTEGARLADRGITWPTLHPATQKIREHYGHGASGPRLIRSKGDLLRSLNVLDVGESFVEAGSRLPHARVLHLGGTWVDPKTGKTRQVQAFPYVIASKQDIDDLMETISDYYLGTEGGDA